MTDEYWSNGMTTYLGVYSSATRAPTKSGCQMSDLADAVQKQDATPKMSRSPSHTESARGGKGGRGGETNVALKSIVAGSVSGIVSTLFFHPFDVLRTKMQGASPVAAAGAAPSATLSSASGSAVKGAAAATAASTTSPAAAGPAAVFAHTVRNGGIRALYTGLQPVLAAQAGYKATVFAVNNLTRGALVEWRTAERRKVGVFEPYELARADIFLCGAAGGAVNAAFLVAPVEYVRNRQIAHHTRISTEGGKSAGSLSSVMRGPLETLRRTVRKHGATGLWRGAGVTVLRDFLGCGGFFVMFEMGRDRLAHVFGTRDATGTVLVSGALAGWGYWALAMPFDTLKTLVQTGAATSAREAVLSSFEREGAVATARSLFHGWQMAFGRGAPAAAVTLASYTAVYDYCNRTLS